MAHQTTMQDPAALADQCRAALSNITFHDMATRQLFETLIARADSLSQTAQALGEQKIL
jgi:hypothetical protein